MKEENNNNTINKVIEELNYYLDLSMTDSSLNLEQVKPLIQSNTLNCWEMKKCNKNLCPAYNKPQARCWLTRQTLCCEKQNNNTGKYTVCKSCDVFEQSIRKNPLIEIEEKLLLIINNFYHKNSALTDWATKDFLTQLYNRRYFDLFISNEIEKLKRDDYQLYITIIDINDFKQINDQYGHLMGDAILKECANILKKVSRKSDLLVRFGGDEFLIVSYTTKQRKNDPLYLINRILKQLKCWNEMPKENTINLSFSFGAAVLTKDRTLDEVLEEADKKMYRYKKIRKIK